MAVATVKAVNVTLRDASPQLPLEAPSAHGKLRVWMDTIATTTTETDDVGDIWQLAEVPSNAKIVSIKLFNDDLAASGLAADIGLYNGSQSYVIAGTKTAASALIDADAYASAATTLWLTANTTGVEVAFEARDINAIHNYVWEDGGLAEDPGVPLRICATITTAATTPLSGDVSIQVMYSVE